MIDAGVEAVFFDAVGTLLFPCQPVARTYAEFARRHGVDADEAKFTPAFRDAFARQEQLDARNEWQTDESRERGRWRAIVSDVLPGATTDACFDELWAWFGKPEAWTINPQAGEVLIELTGRGLLVGVASNFDSRLAALVDGIPDLALLRDRCVISSLVGWRKPAREFFSAIAQFAGRLPKNILYVGDDPRNDILGAATAGMRAILYDPRGQVEIGSRIRCLRDLLST